MTSKKPPVLLFDLDGTLLSINSFPVWVKWMLWGKFTHLPMLWRLKLFIQTATALVRRKAGKDNHAEFKKRLQVAWRGATVKDESCQSSEFLADLMLGYVRDNLRPLINALSRTPYDAILTTAAAEEYAVPLAKKLGFTNVICTRLAAIPYLENLAETKMQNTVLELQRLQWGERTRIFFTDHIDDIPLVKVCEKTFWFGDAESFGIAKQMAPDSNIEWALDYGSDQILEILSCLN